MRRDNDGSHMCPQKVKRGWKLTSGYWADQVIFGVAICAVIASIVRACVSS
jgi:hypothetical protein